LTQEELVAILKENLSSGAYNKLNNEKKMETRTQADLYVLFLERLVQIDTKATWSMTDSLLRGAEVRAEAEEKYPDAQLEFRSWLTPPIPHHTHVIESGVCGGAHRCFGILMAGGYRHFICPASGSWRSDLPAGICAQKLA
jgi:hypothetical protein